MKKIQFIFLSLIMIIMTVPSDINAQTTSNDKESVRVFVQKFYDEYFKIHNAYPTDYILKQNPKYFNEELLAALKENQCCGSIFDPFLSPWAVYPKSNYQTGDVKEYGEDFYVDVHAGRVGESRQAVLNNPLAIIVIVKDIHNYWEIANFEYDTPNGIRDLLADIKHQQQAMEEAMKNPKASE